MRWPVGTTEEDASAIDHLPGQWQNFNPFNNSYRINGVGDLQWHTGVDLILPGTEDHEAPIYAILPGVVTFSGIGGGTWGWIIDIRHTTQSAKVVYARYAHVDHTTFYVPKAGDVVSEGQQIARLGNGDGRYNTWHLHFDLSPTEILATTPNEWPGQNDALLLANYVDPIAFVISEKRNAAQMVMLHNALLQSNSSLIPVLNADASLREYMPPNTPIVVDNDPANFVKVRSIVLLPLQSGGYVYASDAVVGTPYTPPAPAVVEKICEADALVIRADKYHTAPDTGLRVKHLATVEIVDDGGTSSTDGNHSYVYFKLANGRGYIAGIIDGVNYLADPTPVHAANILHGFDSSHYNAWQVSPDFSAVDFVILKGGQGITADNTYAMRYILVKRSGKPVITYLFPNAPNPAYSMVDQAKALLAIVQPSGIMVDYETNTDGTIPSISQLIDFLDAILAATGLTKILLYTRADLLPDNPPTDLTRHDLMLPGNPASLIIPKGWTPDQVKFVQYDQGAVAGVGGPLDLDQFIGTQADLLTYVQSITPQASSVPPPSAAHGHILGINLDPRNGAGNPPVSALQGVSWVRFVFKAPVQGNVQLAAQQAFAFYDPIIAAYRAAGINILLVINHETYASDWPVWFPANSWATYAQHFAAVAGQIAAHYKGQVQAYEIWNEPDDPNPQSAAMAPANFGLVLRGAIPAIRQADPAAKVITGGLTSGSPAAYLRGAGDLGQPDGLGLHPYLKNGIGLEDFINTVAAFGPVWITEHGEPGNNFDDAAHWLTWAYATVATMNTVALYCWYAWSTGMNPQMACIVDASGKPNGTLYTAWQQLVAQDAQNSVQNAPPVNGSNSGANGSSGTPSVPPTPTPVITPAIVDCSEGIHFDDPDLDQQDFLRLVSIFSALTTAGKMVNTLTLMFGSTQNLIKWANMIAPYVKFPVIRVKNWDQTWNLDACKTEADAIAVADHFADVWETILSQLASNFIVQPNCESDHPIWGPIFALQFMKRMKMINRQAAIFSDSPGQPTPDRLDAVIQSRLAAYQYAGENGHFVSIHCYGDSSKPDLPITDPATFEMAGGYVFQVVSKLVKLLPAGSVPRFIITECNRYNSLFIDALTTVNEQHAYTQMLRQHPFAQYVAGNNWFTYGRSFQDRRYECNAALDAWRQMKMGE